MTTIQALKKMMNGWNKIEAAAKTQFPNASSEELFKICSDAMKHALKLA